MATRDAGPFWTDPAVMEPGLSESNKALRDLFVKEFLVDHDEYKACLRIGFLPSVAANYSQQFINEGYVQREIARLEREPVLDDKLQTEHDRQLTLTTLREAMQRGPYSSRVQAASKFAAILGLDAPIKTQNEHLHKGGVMMVPAISDVEAWEKAAQESQERLLEETQKL